jgi:hypothetical protein
MTLAKTNAPLILFEVTPERLQDLWPFLRRGLDSVHKRMHPDWLPESVFTALAMGGASCVIAQRRNRLLGFQVYYRQLKPWSKKPELFIWAAWDLPIKEWQEGDDIPEMVAAMWRYVNNIAISNYGTDVITWGTTVGRARAYEKKYGWKPKYVTFYIKATNGD